QRAGFSLALCHAGLSFHERTRVLPASACRAWIPARCRPTRSRRPAASVLRRMDQFQEGALVATQEAVEAAGGTTRGLSLGGRRAWQELHHGRLLSDGPGQTQDTSAFP